MKKVKITRNTNGDTRVAKGKPSISEFEKANMSHSQDVKNLLRSFADEINARGIIHDYTKNQEPYKSMFYRDLCNTIDGNMVFTDGEWSKLHYETERHHLTRNCPSDVNLIDVIEMICDCVCAGMARSGEVYPIKISETILTAAVKNTVEMCIESVEVKNET